MKQRMRRRPTQFAVTGVPPETPARQLVGSVRAWCENAGGVRGAASAGRGARSV